MDADTLDAEVKARIPQEQKDRLAAIARERHLKVADIVREAIREKIAGVGEGAAAVDGEAVAA